MMLNQKDKRSFKTPNNKKNNNTTRLSLNSNMELLIYI